MNHTITRPHVRALPLATLAAAAVLLAILLADPALAAASAKETGKNLGDLLLYWSKWLFAGVTALFAIPLLGRRDAAGIVVFAALALVVGGFVLAPERIADLIDAFWKGIVA